LQRDSNAVFSNNTAIYGGAISLQQSTIVFSINSFAIFGSNYANRSGGAVYLGDNFVMALESNSVVIFYQSKAALLGPGWSNVWPIKEINQSKILANSRLMMCTYT